MKTQHEISSQRIDFGAKLKAMRIAKGFATCNAFSKAVALDATKVGVIEKGGGYTIDSLVAYLDGLSMTLCDLFGTKSAEKLGAVSKAAPVAEKRPVGRPKAVVVPKPIPPLEWNRYEEHGFKKLSGENAVYAEIAGRGPYLLAEDPSPKFTMMHIIMLDNFDWMIMNQQLFVRHSGSASSIEMAKAAIDKERGEYLFIYDYWKPPVADADGDENGLNTEN